MELWDVARRAEERLKASLPVLWRRESFSARGNYSSAPRWHQLTAIEPGEKSNWNRVWVAACGYRFEFDGLLGKKPETRAEIKTKKLRCSKCDAAIAKGS